MGALRVLLAICVLFQHGGSIGGLNWVRGTTAVEMFFVISGFYMQMILQERYTPGRLGRAYVAKFYCARYARLFPAYFICLVLTVLAAVAYSALNGKAAPLIDAWTACKNLPSNFNNLALWIWLVVCNATMGFQDLALVLTVNSGLVHFSLDRQASEIYLASALAIPQAWSLGVELAFYVVAPFVARLRTPILIVVFLMALCAKCYGVFAADLGDLPYRMLPFVAVDFLAGALAYRYRAELISHALLATKLGPWVAYAIVAVLVAAFPVTDGRASLMMVALIALFLPTIFAATKDYSTDSAIGELSYPFYIFHLLVYALLSHILKTNDGHESNPQVLIWATLLTTLGVSYAVVTLEARFLEPWRRRLGAAPRAKAGMLIPSDSLRAAPLFGTNAKK